MFAPSSAEATNFLAYTESKSTQTSFHATTEFTKLQNRHEEMYNDGDSKRHWIGDGGFTSHFDILSQEMLLFRDDIQFLVSSMSQALKLQSRDKVNFLLSKFYVFSYI